LHWVILPTKKSTRECCSSVLDSWSAVAILTSGTTQLDCAAT
jgi:hypothetical protein